MQSLTERREANVFGCIHPPQGETRWVELHIRPLFRKDGILEGFIATLNDVSFYRMACDTWPKWIHSQVWPVECCFRTGCSMLWKE